MNDTYDSRNRNRELYIHIVTRGKYQVQRISYDPPSDKTLESWQGLPLQTTIKREGESLETAINRALQSRPTRFRI